MYDHNIEEIPPKPWPWWVELAHRVVEDYFDSDLADWPADARIKVLVAALDAEPRGEYAIEVEVHQVAKEFVKSWKGKKCQRHRRRRR